jgi:hypothetical protein
MSDETGFVNDRSKYTLDANGDLTVRGARDRLCELVHVVTGEMLEEFMTALHQALDDVEDAYLRAHDRLGCVRMNGNRADDEVGGRRYACDACRARDVVPECDASARVDAGDDDRVNVGTVTLHVRVSRCDLAGYEAYADSQDEEDMEVNEAMREAGRRRREMLVDADEARQRIFAGVPESRDAAWDAVQDVRQLRDSDGAEACYDRPQTADQEDQVDARDDQAEGLVGRVAWGQLNLQEALDVSPGDQLTITLKTADDGRVQVRSLYVTRACELDAYDEDEDEDDVDVINEIGD